MNDEHVMILLDEAASEYVWGVKSPGRVANQYIRRFGMKIKRSQLKQIIKEELQNIVEQLPPMAAPEDRISRTRGPVQFGIDGRVPRYQRASAPVSDENAALLALMDRRAGGGAVAQGRDTDADMAAAEAVLGRSLRGGGQAPRGGVPVQRIDMDPGMEVTGRIPRQRRQPLDLDLDARADLFTRGAERPAGANVPVQRIDMPGMEVTGRVPRVQQYRSPGMEITGRIPADSDDRAELDRSRRTGGSRMSQMNRARMRGDAPMLPDTGAEARLVGAERSAFGRATDMPTARFAAPGFEASLGRAADTGGAGALPPGSTGVRPSTMDRLAATRSRRGPNRRSAAEIARSITGRGEDEVRYAPVQEMVDRIVDELLK